MLIVTALSGYKCSMYKINSRTDRVHMPDEAEKAGGADFGYLNERKGLEK